jgi:ribonuclease BN (tRNA processing enzyme)
MKIKVIGSTVDDRDGRQFAASYVINERVAVDAGSIGLMSCIASQRKIKHVFLSHSHIDHMASFPIFLDNVYEQGPECPTVYCNDAVRESLLRDVFNDRVWPDLIRLSFEESPFLRFIGLQDHQPVQVDDLRMTPVPLNHVVPTYGFIAEDEQSAIAIISDTSTTDEIWKTASSNDKLKAVFLEAAFPNSMRWLADKAGHLTPEQFSSEYRKLGKDVPVIAIHIKPAFYEEVVKELQALGLSSLKIGGSNAEYEF